LPRRPTDDLRLQPELNATLAEINDRTRHVGVPTLVETDAVAVREPEHFSDALGVDEIFGRLPEET